MGNEVDCVQLFSQEIIAQEERAGKTEKIGRIHFDTGLNGKKYFS